MKIKIESVNYLIKKESGIVVCEMYCTLTNNFSDHQSDYYYFGEDSLRGKRNKNKNDIAHFKVRGISKCHKDDIFDETLGKRIAESRASQKMLSRGIHKLEELNRSANIVKEITEESLKKYKKCLELEKKHIEKLKNSQIDECE